jgi:sulfate/thiosulfate transport system ATP-binding protein
MILIAARTASMRPQDVKILPQADAGGTEALVKRVVHLGLEVRVALTLPDGRDIAAQVSRASAEELELQEGQILSVRVPAPGALPT